MARRFFESRFTAYRVADRTASVDGLLTGYFEPILVGRRERGGRFVHPVYATPPSLLYLDARVAAANTGVRTLNAVVRDRQVIPASEGVRPGEPIYQVALETLEAEPLDRRYRLRRDGSRLVGYYDRSQIESVSQPLGPVLAWVDDADALYVMQVQGSGRIRFPDRKEIRLAYADQNGAPFTPRGPPTTRTRSIPGEGGGEPLSDSLQALIGPDPESAETAPSPPATEASSASGHRTRGIATQPRDPAVERVIRDLLETPRLAKGEGDRVRPAPSAGAVSPASANDRSGTAGALSSIERRTSNTRYAAIALAHLARARKLDRSYVFFRVRTDSAEGPPGALGVPLTAGRSIAVDPRVTPLGAPVFIEAARGADEAPLRRLVMAQDTGGAIRGAVRADFFWGSGPAAGAQALQTRDLLAMWVLLPKGFLESRVSTTRTRSIGPRNVECTAPDSDYCDD